MDSWILLSHLFPYPQQRKPRLSHMLARNGLPASTVAHFKCTTKEATVYMYLKYNENNPNQRSFTSPDGAVVHTIEEQSVSLILMLNWKRQPMNNKALWCRYAVCSVSGLKCFKYICTHCVRKMFENKMNMSSISVMVSHLSVIDD